MSPYSLFDTPESWLADPVEAFAAFVRRPDFAVNKQGERHALRESSVTVYRARWGKFVTECLGPAQKTLVDLSPEDLRSFLSAMSPDSRHRYVHLLERVFDHLLALGLVQLNTARALAVAAPTRSNQGHAGTAVLSSALQEAFLAALPEPVNWKRLRDRALLSVILGAGLRVSEAIHLKVDHLGALQEDGTVPVELIPVGAGRRHRSRIQAFAVPTVLAWVVQRRGVGRPGQGMPVGVSDSVASPPLIAGTLLFPADASGRALHPATVYRRVASVLAEAGISEDLIGRRGARTLRNTYAVRELAAGAPVSLVGESLGHVHDRATKHYLLIARRRSTVVT